MYLSIVILNYFFDQIALIKKAMTPKTTLKTLLLLTLFVGICMEKANAQWAPIKSLGTGANDGCFSFSLHGKGYVGGGSGSLHFYQYDTTANTWTLKGTTPNNTKRAFGFAFAANGKGYAGCGVNTVGPTADMWMYNDSTNTWTARASFPGGERDAMLCFVINDTAYIGGGFDSSEAEWNDFYKYNPFTDTWTPLAALPMGAIGFPTSFVIGNKGYLATGVFGSSESKAVWQYDPSTDTWTPKSDFPGAARQTAFGFTINSYGYVGGGMAGYDTVFTDVWRYNSITDLWSQVQNYTSSYPAWSTAFTVGNTAYVGTGTYFSGSTLPGTDSFKKYWGIKNTTGTALVNGGKQIELYPNPANDYLTISELAEPGEIISINDLTGREVKRFKRSNGSLFVGDLLPNLYVLKCINSTGTHTVEFIKN